MKKNVVDNNSSLEKRLLLLSIFTGLYLTLMLSGALARFETIVWVGALKELLTIPAIVLQFALFFYVIYRLVSDRRAIRYSIFIVISFLVLFLWAILYS